MFCELSLSSQVIFVNTRVADDTFYGNSECEWVKKTIIVASLDTHHLMGPAGVSKG